MNGWRHNALKHSIMLLTAAVLCLLGYARASGAVTVSSFGVQAQKTAIVISWTTATEIGNVGFHVLRSTSSGGSFSTIDSSLIKSNCFGCVTGASYSFTDSSVSAGQTYYYKIQSVDSGGGTQLFGPKSASVSGATATPTATRTPTAVPTSSSSVASSTSTPTSVPGTSATDSPRTATRAPNATALPTTQGATNPTPQTKVAFAVIGGSPAPSQSFVGTRVALSAQPVAGSAPSPNTVVVEPSAEEDELEAEPPAPAPANANWQPLVRVTVFGLAGTFGCGSLILGALAAILFARATRPQ